MAYQKHNWVTREVIRREYLQNIEDGIYNEQERGEEAESTLDSKISGEISRAQSKEAELLGLINGVDSDITDEVNRATNKESDIEESLNAEITRAVEIENQLSGLITANSNAISTESSRAQNAENTLSSGISANTSSINAEVSRATQAESDLHDYVDQQVTRTYKPSGSIYFADLPALAASRLGNVYDIKDDFTTTSDFTEGTGVKYGAGTNVAIVDIGSGTYKYDCMPGSNVIGVKGDSESNYRTGQVNITKANIGLGNVGNYKAVSTVANQGLSDTEKANARANIGAGSATGGTVTQVSTGAGLTGGDITTTGTIKAKLKSETQSSLTAAARGSTSDREYPVGLDADGNLSVNVPWTNTTYTPQKLGFGYATCSTAAATTAKKATLTDYVLVKNGYVSVKFTNSVPANATLNVNSKGAKPIYYHGGAITANIIGAGDLATFIYDGTNYNLVGVDNVSSQIQTLSTNVSSNTTDIQTLTNKDTAIESEVSDVVNVLGAKNLAPITATTQVVSGVTFNVSDDGIVASGTATANISFLVSYHLSVPKSGKYILSKAPSGAYRNSASDYNYVFYLYDTTSSSAIAYVASTDTEVTLDASHQYNVFIMVKSGIAINKTFELMLRPSSIVDDTYVPYAMTNVELTNSVIKQRIDVTITDGTNHTAIIEPLADEYNPFQCLSNQNQFVVGQRLLYGNKLQVKFEAGAQGVSIPCYVYYRKRG